ncbi:MAG TPA: hypothetical protein VHE54_20345 [Puia sp.]|nr:hypothetical protein [Puia sp.]
MHTFLFILYSVFCGIAIVNMRFIRNSGIRPVLLLLLFALHVAVGLAHNIIAYRYYPEHGDVWTNFWISYMYRHRLFHDFAAFQADNASWTHITHNGLVYIQMLLSFVSRDHMDVNTLLFSFPVFLGNIALFRLFRDRFPNDPLAAFIVFLLPSTLFWTSCIHREGVLYLLSGLLLLAFHRMMICGHAPRRLLSAVVCFLLIFYFRGGFALTLVPAIFAWWYLEKPRARPQLSRAAVFVAGAIVVVVLAFPALHLPALLARWQNEFYDLYGHSRLPLAQMDGTWSGFFRVLPAAVRNGLFEPLPGAGGQRIYLVFSIELLAIWAFAIAGFLRKKLAAGSASDGPYARNLAPADRASARPPAALPEDGGASPFGWFAILFCLAGMVLIGLFVPFAGTIVRYRSIYLPFLLAPGLHGLRTLRPLRRLNDWLSRKALTRAVVAAPGK